jgi:uncharacterized delta-60 repeat protein
MKRLINFLFFALFPLLLFSQIQPEWSMVYNGADNYFDNGTAIAADPLGNVIVGGVSVSITNGAPDFIVIKYNPAGEQAWSQVYNGTGNYEDHLAAVTTDNNGNVLVTGAGYEGSSRKDFVTIKYTSSGAISWKSVYKGLNVDNDDAATDIVAGDDGYIYVTGSSAGVSSSMWTDFATIKYSSEGDTIWTRRLGDGGMGNDRATAIAIDPYGFVYVTGYVEADVSQRYNYATVKYKPNGDTSWVRVYNGSGSDEDRAYAIAVDQERNVYITGASWGNFYDDFATIKYDSNGVQKWVSRYNGPVNSYDKAYDLKLDSQGNVYVTGESGGTGGNYDYCTIKYNNDGGEEWVARYNGPDNLDDIATSLVVDNQGNISVTGYSKNTPSPFISTTDMVTIKYNPAGQEQWVHRFNGPGDNDDNGAAITADNAGNVYITGTSEYYGQQNASDIITVKYAGATSVQDLTENVQISVYPNPAHQHLTVAGHCHIKQLEIINLTGKVVCSIINSGQGQSENTVDVSGLAQGVYLLRIITDTGIAVRKISRSSLKR